MTSYAKMYRIKVDWSDPELAAVDMVADEEWYTTKEESLERWQELVDHANAHDASSDEYYPEKMTLDVVTVVYGRSREDLRKLLNRKGFVKAKENIRNYQKYIPRRK